MELACLAPRIFRWFQDFWKVCSALKNGRYVSVSVTLRYSVFPQNVIINFPVR